MLIAINETEAKELLDRLATQPESQIAKDLFDRVTLALEMRVPPPNFDHDPRFDEGGEFYEEANPPERGHRRNSAPYCAKCGGACRFDDDGELLPTANLQWATLGVAQNIVKRVADQMCRDGFDKNDAYLDLQRVVGMLETCMEAKS